MTEATGRHRVKIGCCGFRGSRQGYFRQFPLVEVQQTFYKMPKLETARRWRQEAPADFEFTMKAWQLITHPATSPTYRKAGIIPASGKEHYGFFQPSDEVYQAWQQTKALAEALQATVIVFQCPPSFTETPENITNMRRFFTSAGSGFLFAWEPRGGWAKATIHALCSELGLIHCVDPLVEEPLTGEPQYFRLHGGAHYRHRYSTQELDQLRDMVAGRNTYVLFNNLNMYHDALAFLRLMTGN